MKFDVILHKEDNGYWAEVPALKGCFTQGSTIDEVKENVKEAILSANGSGQKLHGASRTH